jgi:iron complex outermembrane receptor protein
MLFMMCSARAADSEMDAILDMSVEELMEQNVSISTKSEKPLSKTAAPVFVISADDIRRSGAANIPESLRMAPGVQVTQVNPHDWNVSIRGFNDQRANRFLVLVDGRSISTNLSSGTYWRDLQSIAMESIEKIEIIRGAGGTIWGVNAMNGVINIITRSALTTKNAQLTAGGGSEQQGFGRFDYTKKITENASVRGYGTYFNVADAKGDKNYSGNSGSGWTNGARFDWNNKQDDIVMADANWTENNDEESGLLSMLKPPYNQVINSEPYNHQNGHFLTKWDHYLNANNHWAIRAFYERANVKDYQLQMKSDIFDMDFTHYFSFGERNNVTWGGGYRRTNSDVVNSTMITLKPSVFSSNIYNGFVQDEMALDNDKRWLFTFGSKFSYYSQTRFEVEPTGSLSWHINDKNTLWSSISHTIRVPGRGQTSNASYLVYNSLRNVGGAELPVMTQITGKSGIDAENATMYQMGWRSELNWGLTADTTLFYSQYDSIIGITSMGLPTINNSLGIPAIISSFRSENNLNAQSYGAELSVNWQTTEWWRNYLSYTFINIDAQPSSVNAYDANKDEKSTPQHQVSLRTNFNVTRDIDFDVWWRYTDSTVTNKRPINDYFNTDMRVAWRPVKSLELSLVGQNLIQTQHIEYQGDILAQPQATYVSRGVYAKFNWQF